MWVWTAVNQQDTYYIDRYSKNNKLLHWYVSTPGLSTNSHQLQACAGVGEMSVFQSSSCSLQQVPAAALPWAPSLGVAAPNVSSGRAALGAGVCGCHSHSTGSTLRVFLRSAVKAREPILLSKVQEGKRLHPRDHADTRELATVLKWSSCRE